MNSTFVFKRALAAALVCVGLASGAASAQPTERIYIPRRS
jgi:hypothetical protein